MLMDDFYISDGWRYARNPRGFRPDQASGSQQPPPPPPNLAEVMARQTELLNMLCRPSNISSVLLNVDVKSIPRLVIRISSVHNPHSFIRLKNPWMQMHGSVQSSPSLHYSWFRAPKQTKLYSQPNSSVVMPAFGGIITMPCKRMDMSSIGKNLRPPLGRTISRKDSLSGSSMNFWH
jgi:hypothetical protein